MLEFFVDYFYRIKKIPRKFEKLRTSLRISLIKCVSNNNIYIGRVKNIDLENFIHTN